jgi:tetratricopeptide (TPR) repeat protein
MSRTLKLVDHLLARSHHLQECGHTSEALKVLKSVADFGDLPAKSIVEMQSQLALVYMNQRRFKRACSALKLALTHEPDHAQLHYYLGIAISSCKNPDQSRALKHYLRSLELQPDQPDCLADCGLLEIRLGRRREGLKHCRRAAELALDDVDVIKMVAKAFRLANQLAEARKLLLTARFRNSKDFKFQQLWNHYRFHQVRKSQELSKARFTIAPAGKEPVILSFPGPQSSGESEAKPRKTIRLDLPAEIAAPRGILGMVRPDQKHAQ